MKELFLEFLSNFWLLLNSIAFFILAGVIIAGIFKLLLPDSFIKKHLGQHNFFANIKAAILGIPLPLCSCSVIPFVSALKKSGASKSSVLTFLISTPITGADSILATYGVFGWLFTLYRLISSIVISLLAGLLTLFLIKESSDEQQKEIKEDTESETCCSTHPISKDKILNIKIVTDQDKQNIFQQVLSYAFDDIYRDIARSLIIGVIIGGLIVTFMPENLSDYISNSAFLNYALVLLVSMPLYVCATASIPLGLSLLSTGFSPGAAFIFLTAGPATNTVTMNVVLKTLGKIPLIIYLSSVLFGSLFFGFIFDNFFSANMSQMTLLYKHEEDPGFIAQVSSVVLLYLSIKYIFVKNFKLINAGCIEGGCSRGSCNGGS